MRIQFKIPLNFQLKISKRVLIVIAIIVPVVVLASLPLIAKTSTYPIAVVNGSSMVPALHNGDLVFYTAPHGPVKNGTIIVFIQGGTGVNSLDSLLKPIVIHRVVGFGYEPDGSLYYETKGDNNVGTDPFATPASSILGVDSASVPYAGLPTQCLRPCLSSSSLGLTLEHGRRMRGSVSSPRLPNTRLTEVFRLTSLKN